MLILTQMNSAQNFHASDLKRALDARDHELRAWLSLEPLLSRPKARRSATAYTALDLLFLAVIQQLHQAGFAPKALQTFSAALYKAIAQPVAARSADELHLHQGADGTLKMGAPAPDAQALALRLPLQPARARVLHYTGAHLIAGQGELPLLTALRGVKAGTRRASR